MSNINNESILESIFEEVQEDFPTLELLTQELIAIKRFEDLAQ
jgi:hypothetical protein